MGEMNTRCPLPIDWLDFVETGQPDSLAAHLDECASCRAYVDALRTQVSDDSLGDWLDGVALEDAVVWRPRPTTSIAFGLLVMNARDYDGEDASYQNVWRLPFVVLDDGREIRGRCWYKVAPVDTDTENASSTDLLLQSEESDLGVPVRVVFSLQTSLAEEQLSDELGRLTAAGEKTLRQALAGELDEVRYGLPLTGPEDDRLAADRELEEVVRVLRSPFFALAAEAEPAPAQEAETAVVATTGSGKSWSHAARLFYFHLDRVRATPEKQLALAAQSETAQWVYHASLRTEWGEMEGELRWAFMRDTLLFFIERLKGFDSPMQLVVEAKGEEIESALFVPEAGKEVELAGVFLSDVDKIAAKVD
jgi:hypothetical protein